MPVSAGDLEGADLLRGLSVEDRRPFDALGEIVVTGSDEVLFRLGDVAERLWFVRRGRLSLTMPIELRGEQHEAFVEEKGPGDMVGWSAIVPPHRYTLTARATVDAEMVAFDGPAFRELLASRPATGVVVLSNLAALIGHRMHEMQAMWIREVQRAVQERYR